MALDALKGYLQLASGLSDLTRAKATEAADALLSMSSSLVSTPVASQVASLADEIMSAASANRESLKALVRAEVESAVARALAAPGGELDRVRVAVARLGRGASLDVAVPRRDEEQQYQVSTGAQQGSPVSSPITRNEGSMATKKAAPAKKAATAKKAVVTKAAPAKKAAVTKAAPAKKAALAKKAAPAKKAVVKKAAPAKKAVATKKVASATKAAPARKTVVQKTAPAKKSTAKKTTAKKTTAKKTTAKKTTAKKTTAKK